jgi:prepilin-type N-terminal cleavage/methylation domain-containing protein
MVIADVTRARRRQRGMTMIEVMMAIIVATIGLLGSLAMVSTLFRGATYTRNMAEALSLVQSKLESEVSRGALTAVSFPPVTTETLDALGNSTGSTLYPYTRVTTWSSLGTQRLRVLVEVTFSDTQGLGHTVSAYRERNLQ